MINNLFSLFILIVFSLETMAEDSFERALDLNCVNYNEINRELRFISTYSDYGVVDSYLDDAKKYIAEGCEFKTPEEKERFLFELDKRTRRYIAKGRRVKFNLKIKYLESDRKGESDLCRLSITDIHLVKKFEADYGMKLPSSLNRNVLEAMYEKDVQKIKQNINECFSDYVWHLSCGGHEAISLIGLIQYVENRSIEKETAKIFKRLDKECVDPKDKQIVSVFKEYMKTPVQDSLRTEYKRQEKLLAAVMGKADHVPIVREMDRIAKKLNDPGLLERHARLHLRMRLPEPDAYKSYQAARESRCTNIDNTNAFVRRNQDQAGTESCYTFGAANLLNYHLGVHGISPIYLLALSVHETDAFWYPIEGGFRSLFGIRNSISSYNGGFSRGVIERAINKGRYCSTSDVIDSESGSVKMDEVIKKTESVGESALELHKNFKDGLVLKKEYERKNLELFEMVKPFFPKAKLSEFNRSIKNSKNGPNFFTDFLFSQCKTPLPPGARGIKVEASYSFTGLSSIELEKLDQLIENQNIAALGIQADMLFGGDVIDSWSPHVVTLTGRRWNSEKNQCEFRIVNSWGAACEQISNPEIDCDDEKNELWISELLMLQYGNSLTTIIDSPMIRSRRDSNYEEYDPEF